MPLAKTQDHASLKELRLRRFDESIPPRRLIASVRTASIRRCSLEKVCAPTDPKNWLGRIVSGKDSAVTRYLMDPIAQTTAAHFRPCLVDYEQLTQSAICRGPILDDFLTQVEP